MELLTLLDPNGIHISGMPPKLWRAAPLSPCNTSGSVSQTSKHRGSWVGSWQNRERQSNRETIKLKECQLMPARSLSYQTTTLARFTNVFVSLGTDIAGLLQGIVRARKLIAVPILKARTTAYSF